MCGRYHIGSNIMDELSKLADSTGGWKAGSEYAVSGKDIHPGDAAPVITGADGRFIVEYCRWGFPGPDGKGLVFNARSESVFEKNMFGDSVRNRRVVIPAHWFYEWNKSKDKYTFTREDSQVLYLAGFTRRYEDGEHFVILTTEANASMAPVHSRMPLILEKEDVKDWISAGERTEDLLGQTPTELVRSCDYEQMTIPL